MKIPSIRILRDDAPPARVMPRPGETLAQAVFTAPELAPRALCSGLGRCGRCAVRFVTTETAPPPLPDDEAVLGAAAVALGWRLACRLSVESLAVANAAEIVIHVHEAGGASGSRAPRLQGDGGPVRLALDLGTTSLHWAVVRGGVRLATGRELNPQLGAGADVVSRIQFARRPEGLATLMALTQARLEALAAAVEEAYRLEGICLAANAAMTAIVLGDDVEGLAHAPYRLDFAGGVTRRLSSGRSVWIAPQLAPFIGGDAVAGLAALALGRKAARPFLLADMGTNGELLLLREDDALFATSVALGPALEGVGLTHGVVARPEGDSRAELGPVTRFELDPATLGSRGGGPNSGLVACDAHGRRVTRATGLTGTAYLTLVHALRAAGAMRADGGFVKVEAAAPMARRLLAGLEMTASGAMRLRLPVQDEHGAAMALHPRDVEEMLKVRAAFRLAVDALLTAAGVQAGGTAALYIAGALGEHIPPATLVALGFAPASLGETLRPVGDMALEGAAFLCENSDQREAATRLLRRATLVDLTARADFSAAFAGAMRFGE